MNLYYIFSITDAALRTVIVFILVYIGLRIRNTDTDIVKSMIFLRYDVLKSAFNLVLLLSPFFLVSAFLEYPDLKTYYGDEIVHLTQDIFLLIFHTGIIYLLVVLYKTLNRPE